MRRWLPVAVGIACLTATVLLSLAMLSNERHDAQTAAAAMADSIAGRIHEAIDGSFASLIHHARRLESSEQLSQLDWQSDAEFLVQDTPSVVALATLDNTAAIRWMVAREGSQGVIGAILSQAPMRDRILMGSGESHSPRVSPALQLSGGDTALMEFSTIRRADQQGGFLVIIFRIESFLKPITVERSLQGYQVQVLEGGKALFETANTMPANEQSVARSEVKLPGTVWTVQVRPEVDGLGTDRSALIGAVVLGGALISFLLAASIALAQAAWQQEEKLQWEVAERQKSEEEMRESEERFRLAFGDAPIGMALVTIKGRWLRVNHSLCRMVGYSEAELLATDFQSLTHPDDLNADLDLIRQVLAGKIESYSVNKRYFHKSGRIVNASLHVSFVKDTPGRQGYFVSQIEDITQRIEMDRVKNEFISIVSHELRTPLTSIAGSLGLLAGGVAGELPAKAARLVGIAERNSRRLVRLIDDILEIEKAAAGKLEFDLESQPLEPIVRQAIEANQEYARRFGVRLELIPSAASFTVRVDRDRLIQVLTNLISNAAKFSPPAATVSLGIRAKGGSVQVSVQDRGPGIATAFRSRIFQQFARADDLDSRNKGGTGLGLSIAKAFMERLGGSIDYHTSEGEGTTFFITLPLYGTAD